MKYLWRIFLAVYVCTMAIPFCLIIGILYNLVLIIWHFDTKHCEWFDNDELIRYDIDGRHGYNVTKYYKNPIDIIKGKISYTEK